MANIFMEVTDCPGESTNDLAKGWIDVISIQHTLKQPGMGWAAESATETTPNHRWTGLADHGEFTVKKRLDNSSPILARFACEGRAIRRVTVKLARDLDGTNIYMVYTLDDAYIGSISLDGPADARTPIPDETVGFRYSAIHWEYTPYDEANTALPAVSREWWLRSPPTL